MTLETRALRKLDFNSLRNSYCLSKRRTLDGASSRNFRIKI